MFLYSGSLSAQGQMNFSQLPEEIQTHVRDVQRSCRELDPDRKFAAMSGIQILSLNGDGTRDIFVDNGEICGNAMPGANCSNRGCDLAIYKEIARGRWSKVFGEHLHEKHLSIDWNTMRLQQMVVAINAGDARCRPDPRKEYTSGKSCNLTVKWQNNRWVWLKIK